MDKTDEEKTREMMAETDKVLALRNQGGVFTERSIQMIPAIVLPEPKPYYGIEHFTWAQMTPDQRQEAKETYDDSVQALKEIYANLLEPIAVVK